MQGPGLSLWVAASISTTTLVLYRSVADPERLDELAEQLDGDEPLSAHSLNAIRDNLLVLLLDYVHLSLRCSHDLRRLLNKLGLFSRCCRLSILHLHKCWVRYWHVIWWHFLAQHIHMLRIQQLLLHLMRRGTCQACLSCQSIEWVEIRLHLLMH